MNDPDEESFTGRLDDVPSDVDDLIVGDESARRVIERHRAALRPPQGELWRQRSDPTNILFGL